MTLKKKLGPIMAEKKNQKLLHAIVMKPQEGKTFICLKNIAQNNNAVHIILTMNTIKSNKQFFTRANKDFPSRICIFNSKADALGIREGTHCKTAAQVQKAILNLNKDIVVMCSHPKRFEESLQILLNGLSYSPRFNRKVVIHIDEAHFSVPRYREEVFNANNTLVVERIFLYTATPFNLWFSKSSQSESNFIELYQSIFVVDVEQNYGIPKSNKYFGVNDCSFVCEPERPLKVIPKANWFDSSDTPFNFGDERQFLSYIQCVLVSCRNKYIFNDKFSLNFVPAYVRKVTHTNVAERVLNTYPGAVVVVINGDGTIGHMLDPITRLIVEKRLVSNNEPSKELLGFIKDYPNRPVFITGFLCIGMSVTFINEELGNFHNVFLAHPHCKPDVMYQLCRFLFNYIIWGNPNKIEKTRVFSNSQSCIDICLDYERQIDRIDIELSGSIRTLDQIRVLP